MHEVAHTTNTNTNTNIANREGSPETGNAQHKQNGDTHTQTLQLSHMLETFGNINRNA